MTKDLEDAYQRIKKGKTPEEQRALRLAILKRLRATH
jgi:hypothetical protein